MRKLSRSAIGLFGLIAISTFSIARAGQRIPSRYLYVWAGTSMDTLHAGVDMMTVIDANPDSKTYGTVLAAQVVDSGFMPHHIEYVLPAKGALFANDFTGNKSFMIDFSNPLHPRSMGRVAKVEGARKFHTFMRMPNGHIISTYQFGDGKITGDPGGIAEFDAQGKLIRSASSRDAAFPTARIRTYGLTLVPKLDRAVTTSSPMDNEVVADVIQIWRLSDLKLLHTIQLEKMSGDSAQRYPFEARTLDDGSVLMNTYMCGFYHLTNLSGSPKVTRVMTMKAPENIGCSVPIISGKFWIMPIAYAHRFATVDISDPDHPKEVASFKTDSTFYPHWISADPRSDRVVFTEQGDGPPMIYVAHLDRATGRLSLDEKFRDPGSSKPGVSYRRDAWPNGIKGMAMPHGALFVP
ncbi:MAG TPA: hypothetical protein VM099_05290 [Gemmatimonadaceae bacterium]|nr:hypothetical protein [Gemmatimonadaceae bacterium]